MPTHITPLRLEDCRLLKTDGMAVYPMKNFNAHVVSY